MAYIFKERITYSQYNKFLKKHSYVSFMQEDNWAKAKDINDHLIVGILDNNEICAVAHIIINKVKGGKQFLIPNGYLLDFTNKSLLKFMSENIKLLARKYGAYVVDIYPNISTSNPNYNDINNNLLNLKYKYTNEYLDKTDNILIPLKIKKKKISKLELKRKYENKDFYLKRGIYFEISNNIKDVQRLEELVNEEYFNSEVIKGLLRNFDNRVNMVFAKLDLVFYANYLRENNGDKDEINKIDELLTISDEIDIGCALIIEPYNDNGICEFIYNTEKETFDNLDIMNGLLYEAMKIGNEEKYNYIKVSNINLDVENLMNRYKGIPIQYIGRYSIIINKIKYFLNKEIKIKHKN